MGKQGDPPSKDKEMKAEPARTHQAARVQPIGKCYTKDGEYIGDMTQGQCQLKAPGGSWEQKD